MRWSLSNSFCIAGWWLVLIVCERSRHRNNNNWILMVMREKTGSIETHNINTNCRRDFFFSTFANQFIRRLFLCLFSEICCCNVTVFLVLLLLLLLFFAFMLLIHAILKLIFASIYMVLLHYARGNSITAFSFQLLIDSCALGVCVCVFGCGGMAEWQRENFLCDINVWCGRVTVWGMSEYGSRSNEQIHFASILLINYHFLWNWIHFRPYRELCCDLWWCYH